MAFRFGVKSSTNLVNVHSNLVRVAKGALNEGIIDFSIVEGLRSCERQLKLWRDGKSKLNGIPRGVTVDGVEGTGMSNHQDGEAIDPAPYVNGKTSYEWEHVYEVARAMKASAIRHDIGITWGAVWDRDLRDLEVLEEEVKAYIKRREAKGKKAFIDGVHFELRD